MRDTERQRHRQREKAPCREPNVSLHPGTPGSCPRPKADAQPLSHSGAQHLIKLVNFYCFTKDIIKGTGLFFFLSSSFFFFKDFMYLFMRNRERREREAETQAEGESGSMQGARCGTQSQDSRIMP